MRYANISDSLLDLKSLVHREVGFLQWQTQTDMLGFIPKSTDKSKSTSEGSPDDQLAFKFSSASVGDVFLKTNSSPRLSVEPTAQFNFSSARVEDVFLKAKPSPKLAMEPTSQFNLSSASNVSSASVKDVLQNKASPRLAIEPTALLCLTSLQQVSKMFF